MLAKNNGQEDILEKEINEKIYKNSNLKSEKTINNIKDTQSNSSKCSLSKNDLSEIQYQSRTENLEETTTNNNESNLNQILIIKKHIENSENQINLKSTFLNEFSEANINKDFLFYQKNHYPKFFFYAIFPIICVFVYCLVPLYPEKGKQTEVCVNFYIYLIWYRSFYLFINFCVVNFYFSGFLKNNIFSGKIKSLLISLFFTVLECSLFQIFYTLFPKSFFVKNYFHFICFYTNMFFYIIIDQISCLKKSKNKNKQYNFIQTNINKNIIDSNNEVTNKAEKAITEYSTDQDETNEKTTFSNQEAKSNSKSKKNSEPDISQTAKEKTEAKTKITQVEELLKESFLNKTNNNNNKNMDNNIHNESVANLNLSYHRDNNMLYCLHTKYFLGGTLAKASKPAAKANKQFMVFLVFISLSLFSIMYLFCSYFVSNFYKTENFFDKNIQFLLFYCGWFFISRIIQLTLRLWTVKFQNGVFFICLGIQQFFHINYRVLFLNNKFTLSEAGLILVENTLIEFIEFFIPMTSKFLQLKKKCPLLLKVLGYEGKQEYLRFKVAFNYFLKLLSLCLSVFGTLAQCAGIFISGNELVYGSRFNFLSDYEIVFLKMFFTLVVEFIVYLLIEFLIRKYYKISSWKNYYICISNDVYMISSMMLTIHILQDPITTLIGKSEFCAGNE